ncbi:MAG: glycosyltransferase [Cyanobacteria bacterium HKST-UBA04]|nr:glycosyltransferase [Cyanobacteria bacterium HKST-UBA04]
MPVAAVDPLFLTNRQVLNQPASSTPRRQVAFGEAQAPITMAVLTTESVLTKTGGLGAIIGWTTDEFKRRGNMHPYVIAPFTEAWGKQVTAEAALGESEKTVHDTGVRFNYHLPSGEDLPVSIWEKEEPSGVVDILLRNDEVFSEAARRGEKPGPLWQRLTQVDKAKTAPKPAYMVGDSVASTYLFSAMAAQSLPILDGTIPVPAGSTPTPFWDQVKPKTKFDLAWVHDWLTGAAAPQLVKAYADAKAKAPAQVFMVHNSYNVPIALEEQVPPVRRGQKPTVKPGPLQDVLGLLNPFDKAQTALFGPGRFDKLLSRKSYNPLVLGIEMADGIIVNRNFSYEMQHTNLLANRRRSGQYAFDPSVTDLQGALKRKEQAGMAQDMIHATPEAENPYDHPALAKDGFVHLKRDPDLAAMTEYKRANKAALQADPGVGLATNPNATIFLFVNRYDWYQKGTQLMAGQIKRLMRDHADAQFIVYGMEKPGSNLTNLMLADPDLKQLVADKRLVLQNQFNGRDKILQAYAGSDYFVMTSYYEPYGISQLEAKAFGTIPIATAVGGLRSTIADPKWNGRGPDGQRETHRPKETVWTWNESEGASQTGLLVQPFDVKGHQDAVMVVQNALGSPTLKNKPARLEEAFDRLVTSDADRKALRDVDQKMAATLDRAMTMAVPARNQIRLNNLSYLKKHHQWADLVPKYREIFEKAIAAHATPATAP